MKINYKLKLSDFLEYQLYASSKSELQKKTINKTQIIVPIIYVILGGYIFISLNRVIGIIIILLGLLWYIFYPKYAKRRNKKHFEKHIIENYSNRVDKLIELEFTPEFMFEKELTSESKIMVQEFDKLIELKNHFFVQLKSKLAFVIPKHAISDEITFKKKISEYNVDYVNELNWKW
jgi:c-di-AMP phosphodiesterase-like protein